jgi:hypothetical protein
MQITEKVSVSDRFINGLKKAAAELEELRAQAAVGKKEVKKRYEEAKNKFKDRVREARLQIDALKNDTKEKSLQLKNTFETLREQLSLGKAMTREAFESQRKKIIAALDEIEDFIQKNKTSELYHAELQMEIEEFRIKLDILKLQYELKKFDVCEEFEEKKKYFLKELYDTKDHLLKKEKKAEAEWSRLKEEIANTYANLKKSFGG